MNNYLVLVSMAKPNKRLADQIVSNLRSVSADPISTFWIDSAYIGIPIVTNSVAREIWGAAIAGINEYADLRDLLVMEIGKDWLARKDSRASHWLTSHVGHPRPAPRK